MSDSRLVSIVIPAHNAASRLDEALHSARAQTHSALEIIVVDDGSTDDTAAIAARHAEADARLRVLTQDNAGVAAARNTGWRHARSEMIAFMDADDLWAPKKIEQQVRCLQSRGPTVGLVYCWSARINSHGSIISMEDGARCEGDVLEQLLCGNFVGNGSAALVRRQALIDAGGFESGLRAAGAEGCEDFLFYGRVAERHHFAVVPEHLVGYRVHTNAMSRDRIRMLRSWMMVGETMLARHPPLAQAIECGIRNYSGWIAREALGNTPWQVPFLLALLLRRHPSIAARTALMDVMTPLAGGIGRRLRRLYRGSAPAMDGETAEHFLAGRPGVSPPAAGRESIEAAREPRADGASRSDASAGECEHTPTTSCRSTPEATRCGIAERRGTRT